MPDSSDDDQEILPYFWWAEGYAALIQDWDTGDFSTWIDGKVHIRAFGVTFEMSGILEMLPADSRASATRQFSVAGNDKWFNATKAIDFIQQSSNLDRAIVMNALFEQAGFGFVASRAVLAKQSTEATDSGLWAWQRREWDVPPDFWLELPSLRHSEINMETGNIGASSCLAVGGKHLSLSGVHFFKDSIAAIWPPVPKASTGPGGRSAAPFNEDMICAVWKQIYENDLRPRKQADIEKAVLECKIASNFDPTLW